MRRLIPYELKKGRIREGIQASDDYDGMCGAFNLYRSGVSMFAIASDGVDQVAEEWEHVSVSVIKVARCPTWEEMCFVKDLFWKEDETVIQFHPDKAEYINHHPFVLHMWRKPGTTDTLPPTILVGIKEAPNDSTT